MRWSLSRKRDRVDVTSLGDANKIKVQGLPDISGDFEAAWDDADDSIFDASESADGAKMYLYPNHADYPTNYHYGPAWLDASIAGSRDGAVIITGTFEAAGNWGRKP